MVKVNIDENQQVASQLRVQSIPAVFAFSGGQPVDGFMGAQQPSEITAFVKKIAAMGDGGNGLDEALTQAEELLAAGSIAEAAEVFAAVLGEDPANARALAGLAQSLLAAGDIERAKQTVEMAPPEIAGDPAITTVRAAIELAEQTQETGEESELKARLEADPDDHQAGAYGDSGTGRMESVQDRCRGYPDRSAHRLGNRSDVVGTMGRHHARR